MIFDETAQTTYIAEIYIPLISHVLKYYIAEILFYIRAFQPITHHWKAIKEYTEDALINLTLDHEKQMCKYTSFSAILNISSKK